MPPQTRAALKRRFIDGRGTWTSEWEDLLSLDPELFDDFVAMRDVPQRRCHLSAKVQEFIHIAVQASATTVYSPGVREHIKTALSVGATREEIMEVIGLTSLVGVHTVTQGTPILIELLEEQKIESKLPSIEKDERRKRIKADFVKARGFWTDTWNPILQLDPDFFEAYMRFSSLPGRRNILEPKVREILYCAFDAATTHLYNRGTKIHMRNALQLGVTPEEILEMLELVSFIGMNGVVNGASILAQESKLAGENGTTEQVSTLKKRKLNGNGVNGSPSKATRK